MAHDRPFEGILFDMDGVIINSKSAVESFWKRLFSRFGIEMSEDDMLEKLHGRRGEEVINDLFADLTETEKQEALKIRETFNYEQSYELIPGVQNVLEILYNYQIPVGLVTSAVHTKVQRTFEILGTDRYFNTVVTAEDVQQGKPCPDCFQNAAKALGLSAEKCIIFEDSVNGVKAGHTAGALVISVNKQRFEQVLKRAGAEAIIPDFNEAEIQQSENGYIEFRPGNGSLSVSVMPSGNRP